jgi:hypothetical protein
MNESQHRPAHHRNGETVPPRELPLPRCGKCLRLIPEADQIALTIKVQDASGTTAEVSNYVHRGCSAARAAELTERGVIAVTA